MSHFHIKDALQGASVGGLLRARGSSAVAEALSRLVGDAGADSILNWAGLVGLRHMAAPELVQVSGIALELAERVVACRDLSRALDEMERPYLDCSRHVVQSLPRDLGSLETEVMLGCALNARSELIATVLLARGGSSQTALTPKDVFLPMVRLAASAVVLVHTHPSGTVDPSEDDIRFTNRVSAIGRLLGIQVVDHLIVAGKYVLSFADVGLMPEPNEMKEQGDGLQS